MLGILGQIEAEIRQQVTEYKGARSRNVIGYMKSLKTDAKFDTNNPRAKEDDQFEHFVYQRNGSPSTPFMAQEKAFVRMLDRQNASDCSRNMIQSIFYATKVILQSHFADGQAFQPDFVLFLREKNGESIIYHFHGPKRAAPCSVRTVEETPEKNGTINC